MEGKQPKLPSPFCLRLTPEERAHLEQAASNLPLGAYVRAQIFTGSPTVHRRHRQPPTQDRQILGQPLAELGNAKLANNHNQLAKAVNSGSLPVCPQTLQEIHEAYAGITKGDDPKTVKATFRGCWPKSDSKKAFAQALEENGYYLARGDKRGFVAVDWHGEVYSLSKWVGVRTKELKTRLGNMQEMPSIIEVQVIVAKRMTQKLDGYIQEVAAQKKKDAAPLIQARQEMVKRHREERTALKAAKKSGGRGKRGNALNVFPKVLQHYGNASPANISAYAQSMSAKLRLV